MDDEDITDDVKQSGKSPLDVPIDFSRLDLPPSVRDSYNEDDSGNFEEEVSSNDGEGVVAPSLDPSPKRETAPQMATNTAPDNRDDSMDVSFKMEALTVNSPSFVSSPKRESKIKQEPEVFNENVKCEVGNIKEEKLSVEEKAKMYDHLKLEMEGLEKQMEEMRKRLEAQNPPAEVNLKQEPGLQQLSQPQQLPYHLYQPQIVIPWQHQQYSQGDTMNEYSSYLNPTYPIQPPHIHVTPQQQQQYNFQPPNCFRQVNQPHFQQQPHPFFPQPQSQYQAAQGQQELQSNSVQIKSEPSGNSS